MPTVYEEPDLTNASPTEIFAYQVNRNARLHDNDLYDRNQIDLYWFLNYNGNISL